MNKTDKEKEKNILKYLNKNNLIIIQEIAIKQDLNLPLNN